MENWKLYVDFGYGIPQYAVMEILWAMRDKARPDVKLGFDFFVKCKDDFNVASNPGLALSLLGNCRCVGLELEHLRVVTGPAGELVVYFNRRQFDS